MKTSEVSADEFPRLLIAAGLLVSTPIKGVYGLGEQFDAVLQAFDAALSRHAAAQTFMPRPEVLRFPSVVHRTTFERTDYLKSFPDLLGAIHCFHGTPAEHQTMMKDFEAGGDWGTALQQSDMTMLPAACYPLYPMMADQPIGSGRCFDVLGQCFRHEPSDDPARMQCFRQREFVRVGAPDEVLAFRDRWVEEGLVLLRSLGLNVEQVAANDPFFGRAGRLLAATQREDELKWELVASVTSDEKPTAIASSNRHLDHLTKAFGIELVGGGEAHSACVGFGLERCTLALFRQHGLDVERWPSLVRGSLAL